MTTRKLARAGVIAAVYVALCFVLAPLSYGTVQIRFAEALTLLPVLCPEAILGVTLGCFIANLISGSLVDMVVGTLATLLAALTTRRLRNVRFKGLALVPSLPPVLFNAVIVGAELTLLYFPHPATAGITLLNMASVGAGQLISCSLLGVALIWAIEHNPTLRHLFADKPNL